MVLVTIFISSLIDGKDDSATTTIIKRLQKHGIRGNYSRVAPQLRMIHLPTYQNVQQLWHHIAWRAFSRHKKVIRGLVFLSLEKFLQHVPVLLKARRPTHLPLLPKHDPFTR